MPKLVNLTPHPINVKKVDGTILTIPPSGNVARVSQETDKVVEMDGIQISEISYGYPEGLPSNMEEDTYLIVSAMVAQHPQLACRSDLLSPGVLIRDENGNIVGCEGLYASSATAKWLRGELDDCLNIIE